MKLLHQYIAEMNTIMSDVKEHIENVCNDSIVANGTGSTIDVIWSTAETLPLTHFTNENCLPDIGSCQVSSILSTIENRNKEMESPIQLDNSGSDQFKSIAFNVCSSDTGPLVDKRMKRGRGEVVLLEQKQLYEEMVFFGCNLCPFICTKDSKISDHINSVHRNPDHENHRLKLKCPGCTNVFYHKLSLRSHLIYDHEVGKSDISKIVNGIVYVSSLLQNENGKQKTGLIEESKKPEMDFLNENHMSSEEETELTETTELSPDTPEPEQQKQETEQTKLEENLVNEVLRSNPQVDDDKHGVQKCPVPSCAVRMRDMTNMAYHMRSHIAGTFQCAECGEKAAAWRTLQTHLWHKHQIDMEMYACDKCDYKTHSLAKLNNVHRLIHGDEKPFLCDDCGKGFKNPKQLRNHKLVHRVRDGEVRARHECGTCHRVFSDRRQLRVHISSVHDKIKPFSCTFCGYKAASNGALKLHIRQHTGERPFTCDSCDYATSDHNSLRRHKLRHSGVKKYKCAHCSYACIQSSTYKTHLKTKHPGLDGDVMHTCQLCQFRTLSSDKYMIHIATHSGEPADNNANGLQYLYNDTGTVMQIPTAEKT